MSAMKDHCMIICLSPPGWLNCGVWDFERNSVSKTILGYATFLLMPTLWILEVACGMSRPMWMCASQLWLVDVCE